MVSLKILNIVMPPIVPSYICLPLSIGISERNGNSRTCLMINATRKTKKIRIPRWGLDLATWPPFHRKWRDEFINSSDPSSGLTGLEPAASALTGRCSDRLNYNPSKMYGIHILTSLMRTFYSLCCNRNTNDILNIHIDMEYSESDTDY